LILKNHAQGGTPQKHPSILGFGNERPSRYRTDHTNKFPPSHARLQVSGQHCNIRLNVGEVAEVLMHFLKELSEATSAKVAQLRRRLSRPLRA
jgi:hypothetical protein